MTRTLDEVNREITRTRRMPHGMARTQAAEQQVKAVEAEGPDEARAYALFTLVESYQWGGEPERSFVPFAQMLRWWDERPEMFDEQDEHSLFWSFKWMASGLSDYPNIPAAQIERTLDDMERRYSLAGKGLDAVRYERFVWARMRGSDDQEQLFQTWIATPRDDFSQCEACDPGDRASYLFATGRTEEGIRLIEETLTHNPSCASEPADMLSYLADAYLDTGRAADAARTHRRAVAALADAESDMVGARGRRIRLLARAGQPVRAVRAIESEQHLLTGADNPYSDLVFARTVGAATHVLRAEHADAPLRLSAVPAATVAELDDWLHARADDLAGQFDRRNGTDSEAVLVAEAWAAVPAPVTIDLDVLPRDLTGTLRTPVPATADAAEPGSAAVPDEDQRPAAERAEALAGSGDLEGAAAAYLAAAAQAEAAGLLVDAGFALAEAAHCAQALGDDDGAAAGYQSAVGRLRAGGTDAATLVQVVVAWAGAAAATGGAADLLTEVDRLVADLQDPPHPAGDGAGPVAEDLAAREQAARRRAVADLEDTAARLLATLGGEERTADAAARAQRAAETYGGLGALADAGHAFWLAGRLCDGLGRVDEAVWNLESAMEGFGRARQRDPWGEAANLLVDVLRRSGQTTRAEELAREIVG